MTLDILESMYVYIYIFRWRNIQKGILVKGLYNPRHMGTVPSPFHVFRVAKVTKGMSADEAARIAQETEEAMRPYAISSMGLVYLPT